jgi:hypothetical protein
MRLHGKATKLEGQRFGRLQVLQAVRRTKAGKTIWLCRCDCGAFSVNTSGDMRAGKSASCGCFMWESLDTHRAHDLTGKRFRHLTAQRMMGQDKDKNNLWQCLCDCGRTHVTAARNLVNGDTGSCGAPSHHPCCNPDLTPEQRLRGRIYPELKAVRLLALKRDTYKCLLCGSNKRLRAHHMEPWCRSPELRFSLDNLVVLCSACHMRYHHKYHARKADALNFVSWFLNEKQENRQ